MRHKFPVVRQINWFTFALQIIILVLFMCWFDIILGALVYLVLSMTARYLITQKHRKGMKLLKRGKVDEAIVRFHESYNYFNKHIVLNRYIGQMLSVSRIT
ncbi:hypothetical protein SDC9_131034 [bioreactor metagenome]|uniref:Uncharacterized protein n=1 Tax=bioreactor metagenome TaxID=1076179 RepID=A0A645D3T2_9ZZZZ